MDTSANTARIVQLVRKPAYVLISMVPLAPKPIGEAMDVARGPGLDVAPVIIHRRVAFGHAQTLGIAACEYDQGSKAAGKMVDLWAWLAQFQISTVAQSPTITVAQKHKRDGVQA